MSKYGYRKVKHTPSQPSSRAADAKAQQTQESLLEPPQSIVSIRVYQDKKEYNMMNQAPTDSSEPGISVQDMLKTLKEAPGLVATSSTTTQSGEDSAIVEDFSQETFDKKYPPQEATPNTEPGSLDNDADESAEAKANAAELEKTIAAIPRVIRFVIKLNVQATNAAPMPRLPLPNAKMDLLLEDYKQEVMVGLQVGDNLTTRTFEKWEEALAWERAEPDTETFMPLRAMTRTAAQAWFEAMEITKDVLLKTLMAGGRSALEVLAVEMMLNLVFD